MLVLTGPGSGPGGEGPESDGPAGPSVPFSSSGGSNTPPVPPTPVRTGRNKALIRRDPTVDRREGRNWEILVEVLNSLMLGGYIYKVRTGVWAIQVTGTNGLTGSFSSGEF